MGIVAYVWDIMNILSLEQTRTGPLDQGKGLARYKLYIGPFIKICQQGGLVR